MFFLSRTGIGLRLCVYRIRATERRWLALPSSAAEQTTQTTNHVNSCTNLPFISLFLSINFKMFPLFIKYQKIWSFSF